VVKSLFGFLIISFDGCQWQMLVKLKALSVSVARDELYLCVGEPLS